jgi:transposase
LGQEVKLRHLPILGKPCYLIIKPKRGICDNCDDSPTTNQRLDWYEYKSRYTKDYEAHVLLSLVNSTVVDVAIKERIGTEAINGILKRRVDKKVDWRKIKAIELLVIDEISLKKGHQDFVTIITSRLKNKVNILAVIKGREKLKISSFLSSIPRKLKKTISGICCDMYDGYVNAAKEAFSGKVPVIVDRFHVAKLYRKCLVELRKSELARLRKTLSKEKYQALSSAIKILKRNKEFITTSEKDTLKKSFHYSPKLKSAYKLCCQLTGIYNSKIGKKQAVKKINEWSLKVLASDLTCFNRFIKTLKKYKNEVVSYFQGRHTSSFVEGFNNKVKVLKRRCYGIFDEKSLFRRLFLDCSGYETFHTAQGLAMI